MIEAAACQRDTTLSIPVTKACLLPGDYCKVAIRNPEPFTPKAEKGIFLCRDHATSKGTHVLVERNGRMQLIRQPRKLMPDGKGGDQFKSTDLRSGYQTMDKSRSRQGTSKPFCQPFKNVCRDLTRNRSFSVPQHMAMQLWQVWLAFQSLVRTSIVQQCQRRNSAEAQVKMRRCKLAQTQRRVRVKYGVFRQRRRPTTTNEEEQVDLDTRVSPRGLNGENKNGLEACKRSSQPCSRTKRP